MSHGARTRHYLGIDLGTSGCRAMVIDATGRPVAQAARTLPAGRRIGGILCQDPHAWWSAVTGCLAALGPQTPLDQVAAVLVDSTSGTLLLTDATGEPTTAALMYNDQRPSEIARRIHEVAGPCAAASVTSSLAKLLWLHQTGQTQYARHALHAADWIAGRLTGRFGTSDDHNALKTGFDAVARKWPAWMTDLGVDHKLLPVVSPPGTAIGTLRPELTGRYGFSSEARVLCGTTDSIAAFLATGASVPGDAVTVLGSTLVTKVVSAYPVTNPRYGVYSHRVAGLWLVGGASNTGGRALERYLALGEIERLSPTLDTDQASELDFYPLPDTGERFPVADPNMVSRVSPVPTDRRVFLHGLLEGIARVERDAYALLHTLGAEPVRRLYSAGSGARNTAWNAIRQRVLGNVVFARPLHTQAAYGSARLAMTALEQA